MRRLTQNRLPLYFLVFLTILLTGLYILSNQSTAKSTHAKNIRLKTNSENEILDQVLGGSFELEESGQELELLEAEMELHDLEEEEEEEERHEIGEMPRIQEINQISNSNLIPKPFLSITCPVQTGISVKKEDGMMERSILFAGTGVEVRRVLKRSIKSSLYGIQRKAERTTGVIGKEIDENPFRILVLGGSVSNCRGVELKDCWHSHLLSWFQRTLPLEQDPIPPPIPSTKSSIPKRSLTKLPIETKKKSKKKSRGKLKTKLINSSKSATGSAFFAYCFEEEMKIRRKDLEMGLEPDLIILEFGVNDVFPLDLVGKKNFEMLLMRLRNLKSKPAIIILEAASLLLKRTTGVANYEFMHEEVAKALDIPILSAASIFNNSEFNLSSSSENISVESLFLVDKHHPNEAGHRVLAGILTSYLEKESCEIQEEILRIAQNRGGEVDPRIDFGKRSEERVKYVPTLSIFDQSVITTGSTCLQIGRKDSKIEPIANEGWTNYAWSRDKQYLLASVPGATVTFRVQVGSGGTILVDWLRSSSFSLGDVLITLDSNPVTAVQVTSFWSLRFSVGSPEVIFSNVERGEHEVEFKLLGKELSGHPEGETNFRLIGLIST